MELKIGTMLLLEPTYNDTEQNQKLQCKVVDRKDHILYINYPVNKVTNKTVFLLDGSQFRATFHSEDDDLSYAFNTEVLGRKLEKIPMIMIKIPPKEEFVKIQRREFVRVNTRTDIAIKYNGQFYQYVTEDISAGGLAIKVDSSTPFKEGTKVFVTVVLPFSNGEINYIFTDAIVTRIFGKDNVLFASLQFIDTDEVDQRQLIRFCFERQLLMRKKEL